MSTEFTWREVSCPTSVRGDDFPLGVQDFSFNIGNPNAWIPSRSYFKVDMTLTQGGGANTKPGNVALAENAVSCLYNSASFSAGGRDVSSIRGFVPQVQSAKTRLQTTYGWQKSVGKAAYGIESDFGNRLDETKVQNTASRIWQPPIGIFKYDEPMGAGDYRFQLNPSAKFEKAAIESTNDRIIGVGANEYRLVINNVRLFVCTVKMSIPSSVRELELTECKAQSKPITADGTLDFTVPSGTFAITVFVQDSNAGSNNLLPPTKFKVNDKTDENLQALQVTYANTSKPTTRWASQYDADVNQVQQRYLETHLESGLIHSQGGAETIEDYMNRGMMYHFSFDKDSEDKSTQVQVSTEFSGIGNSAHLFILAFYKQKVEITTNNGYTANVRNWNV